MSINEMVDILNDQGEVIGTVSREEAERDNHTTPNVLVFVFKPSGEVWAQLRPLTKKHYPGMWDISACGGVVSGETVEQAAARETAEEVGVTPKLHYVETFLNIFPGDDGEERRRMSHLFVGVSDEQPQLNDEVDEFKAWVSQELLADIASAPKNYVPSFALEFTKALEFYTKNRLGR